MTNIIFTNPEYRRMAFKRKGHRTVYCASDLQVRKMVIKEYKELPFNPDSLTAPSAILDPQPTPALLPTFLNSADPPVPGPFTLLASTPALSESTKPDPLPPPRDLNEVARRVIGNDFLDFGDPDHLALIRLSGDTFMNLLTTLADDYYHTELRPPNMVINTRNATCIPAMKLQDQLDFLAHSLRIITDHPTLRTYEEIVALAEEPAPSPA